MKLPEVFCLFGLAILSIAQAEEMREAPTHEEMLHRLRVQRQNDPMKDLQIVEGDDPSKTNRPADILETSEFLSFSGLTTLVPKGAVLHVPAHLQTRIGNQSGTRIVTWSQFLAENRSWIEVVEFQFAQVAGKEPLPAGLIGSMKDSRRIMVAAVQGGPISVPPAKIEEARAAAEAK